MKKKKTFLLKDVFKITQQRLYFQKCKNKLKNMSRILFITLLLSFFTSFRAEICINSAYTFKDGLINGTYTLFHGQANTIKIYKNTKTNVFLHTHENIFTISNNIFPNYSSPIIKHSSGSDWLLCHYGTCDNILQPIHIIKNCQKDKSPQPKFNQKRRFLR